MTDVRNLIEVAYASTAGAGTRLVVQEIAAPDTYGVLCRKGDEQASTCEAVFTLTEAREIAMRVLAGDPRTSTAHATLRTLAAAVALLVRADQPEAG